MGTKAEVNVREIPAGSSLEPFIDLSWSINRTDPHWIPPLRSTVRSALDREKHPFHEHADVAYFLAERSGAVTGRIAAIVNHSHNEFHDESTGFFGLFECEDDPETAAALLDAAADWLGARSMRQMVGPVNLSTNDEVSSPGILIEGFDSSPYVMMSHNPPYYESLLVGAGLEQERDLLAYQFDDNQLPERLAKGFDRLLARAGATLRPLSLRHFRRDLNSIKKVYNSAWSRNWGFVPMSDAEFEHLADEFRPVVDPDLCLIAEVDGEPVGFSLALPDLNVALRHLPDGRLFPFGVFRFLWHRRKIRQLRVLTLGIRPEYQHLGLGAAFYARTWQTGVEKGYVRGEASWILDGNTAIAQPMERLGAQIRRRYRLYRRSL